MDHVFTRELSDEQLVRTIAAGQLAEHRVDDLRAEIADLRDAIRLLIGREKGTPWHDVPNADVDDWLAAIRDLKTRYRAPESCDYQSIPIQPTSTVLVKYVRGEEGL